MPLVLLLLQVGVDPRSGESVPATENDDELCEVEAGYGLMRKGDDFTSLVDPVVRDTEWKSDPVLLERGPEEGVGEIRFRVLRKRSPLSLVRAESLPMSGCVETESRLIFLSPIDLRLFRSVRPARNRATPNNRQLPTMIPMMAPRGKPERGGVYVDVQTHFLVSIMPI